MTKRYVLQILSAIEKEDLELTQQLLAQKTKYQNINIPLDDNNETLLIKAIKTITAVKQGSFKQGPLFIQLLLRCKADITCTTKQGHTILTLFWGDPKLLSCFKEHRDISKIINIPAPSTINPLETHVYGLIQKNTEKNKEGILRYRRCIQLLLFMGANPSHCKCNLSTLLEIMLPHEMILFEKYNAFKIKTDFLRVVGSVLGIDTFISMKLPYNEKKQVRCPTSRLSRYKAIPLLQNFGNHYIKTLSTNNTKTIFNRIVNTFNLAGVFFKDGEEKELFVKCDLTKKAQNILQEYQNNQIIIIPVYLKFQDSPYAHLFGIALYKNILIWADKASTNDYKSITVFEIDPREINVRFIISLISSIALKEWHDDIRILLEYISSPSCKKIAEIKLKAQEHHNCAYTNMKALISGLLCVLKFEEIVEINSSLQNKDKQSILLKSVPTYPARLDLKSSQPWWEAEIWAYQEYKKFSNFTRNDFIHFMLNTFKTSTLKIGKFTKDETENIKYFLQLFILYLKEHHGQAKEKAYYDRRHKIAGEIERSITILKALLHTMIYEDHFSQEDLLILLTAGIHTGDEALVKKMLRSKSICSMINHPNENGETPFLMAARLGHLPIVNLFLNQSASIRRKILNLSKNKEAILALETDLEIDIEDSCLVFSKTKARKPEIEDLGERPVKRARLT